MITIPKMYRHVEGNEAYQKAKKFMKELMPKNVKNSLKKYRGKDTTIPRCEY